MKIFSPNLKRQIRDCILSIFWPKKEIYAFFKDCSCPVSALKVIENWEVKEYSRADMINELFSALGDQPDNGTLQFNIMLDALSSWNHFDDFWFNKEKKLDLNLAKANIQALKLAKENDIEIAKKRAVDIQEKQKSRNEKFSSLEEMREYFQIIARDSETNQARGHAFEKFLSKMGKFFNLKVTDPFKIKGTQIDGSIKYDGENYNLEAKWHDRSLSDEPLLAFCHKQEINMHGRGIFISINGYTSGALSMLEKSNIKNTMLMDGEDIALILNELITLPQVLEKKIHAAQTGGMFYINPITGACKIRRS